MKGKQAKRGAAIGGGSGEGTMRVLLALHSGTYDRSDDVTGAFILADTLLTEGIDTTILLRGDGVYSALQGQKPRALGLESLLEHLEAAVEMGARVVAVREALEERGLDRKDMPEYVELVSEADLPALMSQHEHWMPF